MQATNQFTLSDEAIRLVNFLLREHRKGLGVIQSDIRTPKELAEFTEELELTEQLLDYIKPKEFLYRDHRVEVRLFGEKFFLFIDGRTVVSHGDPMFFSTIHEASKFAERTIDAGALQ